MQGQDFSNAMVAALQLKFVALYSYAIIFFLEMRLFFFLETDFETCLSQDYEELCFPYSSGTVCIERSMIYFSMLCSRLDCGRGICGCSQVTSDHGPSFVGIEIRGRSTGAEDTLGRMWLCAFGEPSCWKLYYQYKSLRTFFLVWKTTTDRNRSLIIPQRILYARLISSTDNDRRPFT